MTINLVKRQKLTFHAWTSTPRMYRQSPLTTPSPITPWKQHTQKQNSSQLGIFQDAGIFRGRNWRLNRHTLPKQNITHRSERARARASRNRTLGKHRELGRQRKRTLRSRLNRPVTRCCCSRQTHWFPADLQSKGWWTSRWTSGFSLHLTRQYQIP